MPQKLTYAMTAASSWPWVRSLLHSVYDRPDAAAVHAHFDRVLDTLTEKLPKVAEHLDSPRRRAGVHLVPERDLAPDLVEQFHRSAQTGRSVAALTWSGSSPTATP